MLKLETLNNKINLKQIMNIGKILRISRILDENGKTVIVPIDHGIEGYYPELERPEQLINEFIDGGANAVLLRRGMLEKVALKIAGKLGVVYRITGATGSSPDVNDQRVIASTYEALYRGADAVVFTIIAGHPKENDMFTMFGEVSDIAYSLGLPLIGEVDAVPSPKADRGELLRQGTRYLSEEGADLIKTYFPEDESFYKSIIKYSLVPVIAAGGPKMDNPKKVLEFAQKVMEAGAVGVCFGRNVWQYERPSAILKALSLIVKKGKTAEEASKLL